MKILIVEDQIEKAKELETLCIQYFKSSLDVTHSQSLRGGLREIVKTKDFNLILLDMSMPNFDPSPDDPLGGTPESFAGKEFLAQLKLRNINVPVIIVTQYHTFEEGLIELNSINSLLLEEFGNFYLGAVYYSSADKEWESKLTGILNEQFDAE